MELHTFSVHKEQVKGKASTQVTFDEDYNLADYKPDFSALIMSQGRIRMEETKVTEGHVTLKGSLKFEILYRTDQAELGVCSLEGSVPFVETLAVDEAEEFDTAQVTCTLEDLSVNMTNSRKLGIRALMGLGVCVSAFQTENFPKGMKEEGAIQVMNRPLKCLHVSAEGKDQCRIHEELELPADKQNIREILWKQIRMQAVLAKPENGKVRIQGEIAVFFLYVGEPKTRLEWYETTIPVVCDLEVPRAEAEQICYVRAEVQDWNIQSQEDLEGEMRVFGLDGALKVDYRLYEEREEPMLADLYALDRTLTPVRESVHLEQLLMKNESRCKVSDTLMLEEGQKEILQICSCFGNVQLDHMEPVEDGILVEGAVHVQVLYVTQEDRVPLDAAEGMLPFSYKIEAPGIQKESRVELHTGLALMSVMMKSANILELQAMINFNVMVFLPEEIARISSVGEGPADLEVLQQMPGMIGLRTVPGDSLWRIAKEHHTTMENIRNTNPDLKEPLAEGTEILLQKQIW